MRPRPDLASAPPLRVPDAVWQAPAQREPCLTGQGAFLFLGEPGRLTDVGWDGPEREKLWRYNQHYFDDLNARDGTQRADWHRALLTDWVFRNSPGYGNGWEPYPTSLRIVNWVKWALAGNALPEPCIQSLAVQARWLRKRLEIHLLGNHLFANAKALVFAGLFFDGEEADRWLKSGLRVLSREVPEQILPDGGHFERSTMYHVLALEDMLDLCNLGACFSTGLDKDGAAQLADWRQRVPRMRDWLRVMCHTDGEIGFFNDAALGIAPTVAELEAYATRLFSPQRDFAERGAVSLANSGYIRLGQRDAVILLDVAPVGPDYLPGHAHADTLSFELSLGRQRVLVNSGTSCYGASAERLRQRGTAAHNTVVVDGQDSSEVWNGFRVARRARPLGPKIEIRNGEAAEAIEIRCAHDGYRRLRGKPIHERRWLLIDNRLIVRDEIRGPHRVAEARFHLHPDLTIRLRDGPAEGAAILPDGREFSWKAECGESRLERATWHPRFGTSVPNMCLVVRLSRGVSRVSMNWA